MIIEMTYDQVHLTLDAMRILKVTYQNIRGLHPDEEKEHTESIDSLILQLRKITGERD